MVPELVLAGLFPDKHDVILGEARSIGWHHVHIAQPYPTEIHAERMPAQASFGFVGLIRLATPTGP